MAANKAAVDQSDLRNGLQAVKTGQQVNAQGPTVYDLIKSKKKAIENALPDHIGIERFVNIALTAVANNPQLQLCTEASLIGGLIQAAQLGLEPNTPLQMAYLIPYENSKKVGDHWNKVLEAQFQIGYHGTIHLMWQSGMLADLHWSAWHRNDIFEVHEGTDKKLIHRPELFKARGDVVGYYAVAKTKFGGAPFDFMTVPELVEHGKKFSKGYEKSGNIWQKNFGAAAYKTVLKQVSKYMPKTADREAIRFHKAMMADGTIKHELDKDMTDVHDVTDYSVTDATDQLEPGEGAMPDELDEAIRRFQEEQGQ